MNVRKTIPPLRALIAFEAAVRHASFKRAAEELCITPGAVSQQILKLESWLGYPLFTRQVRKLKVTEQGMSYFSEIAPALEQISAASEQNRITSDNKVSLSMTQALASKWLGPRLENFVSQFPEIEVHINASNNLVDFHSDNIDLAIRHFDGKSTQLYADMVFEDELRVLCSPEYKHAKMLDNPEQLRNTTLIVTTVLPYWERWFNNHSSLQASTVKSIPRLHFDQSLLSIDAAKRGQGVVLSNTLLVQEELKHGDLIEPFPLRLTLEKNYYLVHPASKQLSPAVLAFKQWLLKQFRQ